jgi:hypothetical protein
MLREADIPSNVYDPRALAASWKDNGESREGDGEPKEGSHGLWDCFKHIVQMWDDK